MTTIAIDLGTTNSAVAFLNDNDVELIETSSGQVLMPSVVAIDSENKITVGHQALRKLKRERNPEFVFSNIKRHIGLPYREGEDYGSQITNVDGEQYYIGPNERVYSPTELSAEILKALKAAAEKRLGKKVKRAVVTVPAGWDNNRVLATKEAGLMAGFKEIITKPEPEMAALAFGMLRVKMERLFIYDLGGGTFDAAIGTAARGSVTMDDNLGEELGGSDFDKAVWRYLAKAYQQDEGKDLNAQQIAQIKLMPIIEDAKRELSDAEKSVIEAVGIYVDYESGGTRDIKYDLTREKFDELTQHLVDSTITITKRLLERNNKTVREFDQVLLVGGMTRVPAVRAAIEGLFGSKRIRDRENPDLAVVKGAAIAAAQEDGTLPGGYNFSSVTSSAFGLEDKHGQFVVAIPRGASAGDVRELVVTTKDDGQPSIPIAILQGDPGAKAIECVKLARYEYRVEPGPARKPRVSVQFMVDDSGQLIVTGQDQKTKQNFTIREP